jgi:hypothetical protein
MIMSLTVPAPWDSGELWPDPWQGWRIWSGLPENPCDALGDAGSIIAAEVYDSDAAKLVAVSQPSGCWMTYLDVERVLDKMVTGPIPFDEDGNEITGTALEELEAPYQAERAEARQRLITTFPIGLAAAEKAATWARESGLTPASADELRQVLDGSELFVEELFFRLFNGLGFPVD